MRGRGDSRRKCNPQPICSGPFCYAGDPVKSATSKKANYHCCIGSTREQETVQPHRKNQNYPFSGWFHIMRLRDANLKCHHSKSNKRTRVSTADIHDLLSRSQQKMASHENGCATQAAVTQAHSIIAPVGRREVVRDPLQRCHT